jgi:hypothetical protein
MIHCRKPDGLAGIFGAVGPFDSWFGGAPTSICNTRPLLDDIVTASRFDELLGKYDTSNPDEFCASCVGVRTLSQLKNTLL